MSDTEERIVESEGGLSVVRYSWGNRRWWAVECHRQPVLACRPFPGGPANWRTFQRQRDAVAAMRKVLPMADWTQPLRELKPSILAASLAVAESEGDAQTAEWLLPRVQGVRT